MKGIKIERANEKTGLKILNNKMKIIISAKVPIVNFYLCKYTNKN